MFMMLLYIKQPPSLLVKKKLGETNEIFSFWLGVGGGHIEGDVLKPFLTDCEILSLYGGCLSSLTLAC